jgi:hypothetical protein
VQVRGLIARGGQAFLIFKAAWRQQDRGARTVRGCHEPDHIGTPEGPMRVNDAAGRRLPKADAEEVLSLAPEPMPRLFAADLAGAPGEKARAARMVLLLTLTRRFFGEAVAEPRALLQAALLMQDEWLCRLLSICRWRQRWSADHSTSRITWKGSAASRPTWLPQ